MTGPRTWWQRQWPQAEAAEPPGMRDSRNIVWGEHGTTLILCDNGQLVLLVEPDVVASIQALRAWKELPVEVSQRIFWRTLRRLFWR